jgi:hypothetical protein
LKVIYESSWRGEAEVNFRRRGRDDLAFIVFATNKKQSFTPRKTICQKMVWLAGASLKE